jgi:hypothetical protein
LAHDGDTGVFVILVAGWSIVGWVTSSGSDGQDSGDNELRQEKYLFYYNYNLIQS